MTERSYGTGGNPEAVLRQHNERRWVLHEARDRNDVPTVSGPRFLNGLEVVRAAALDQALAERDRLAEVAKEMAELLKIVRSGAKDSVLGGRVAAALDRYEALRDG